MYYLFITKPDDLRKYKTELDRVLSSMDSGKTPVFNELRSAKTQMYETLPRDTLSGVFLIASALIVSTINLPETIMVAVVLVVNSLCNNIANYLFTVAKHKLRILLCKRLEIEPSERNIAAMESLEYQSV